MKYLKIFEYANNELAQEVLKKYGLENTTRRMNALSALSDDALNNLLNVERPAVIDKYFFGVFLELYTFNNYAFDISIFHHRDLAKKFKATKILSYIEYLTELEVQVVTQDNKPLYNAEVVRMKGQPTTNENIPEGEMLKEHTVYKIVDDRYIFTPDNTNIRDKCDDLDIDSLIYIISQDIINNTENKSSLCIQRAVRENSPELLKLILKHNFYNKNALKNNKQILLLAITKAKNAEVLKMVINLFKDYTITIANFSNAVRNNNYVTTKLLLEEINIDTKDADKVYRSNNNPFTLALENNNLEIFKLLVNTDKLDPGFNNNALMQKIFSNTLKASDDVKAQYVKTLLESPYFDPSLYNVIVVSSLFTSHNSQVDSNLNAFKVLLSDDKVASSISNVTVRESLSRLSNQNYIITDKKFDALCEMILMYDELDYSNCTSSGCLNTPLFTAIKLSHENEKYKAVAETLLNNEFVIKGLMNMDLMSLYNNPETKPYVQYILDMFEVDSIRHLLVDLSMLI